MIEKLIRKFALHNALHYDGKANAGSVIGKIMAEQPELRAQAKEIVPKVKTIVNEINSLSIEQQQQALAELAPELLEHKATKPTRPADEHSLPPLTNVENYRKVIMRFAPGPSGPLHVGHSRAAILNDAYTNRYEGELIIRMEDTNPAKIDGEAYDMILEDLDWLGVTYDHVVIQSKRFELYYQWAKTLLENGHAYICECPPDDWRAKKRESVACEHRSLEPATHLEKWQKLLEGYYKPGEVSYIVKTDLAHPNPAVRDFVGFRVSDVPHPRTADAYCVYPLMNFSVAVDDHELGLTHVLRGKDHLNNTYRQEYLFRYLNWPIPEYIHYGWVTIEDTILKTSIIKEGILAQQFAGWSDPRLGTFRALAARGIEPAALRRYWLEVGIKDVDIQFSWKTLMAYNKSIIDPEANRYFFVWAPQKLTITNVDTLTGYAPKHPDRPERGVREIVMGGQEGVELLVCLEDVSDAAPGTRFRLKDLGNIRLISDSTGEYIGNDLAILKEGVKIIHWVPLESIPTVVNLPDGTKVTGLSEPMTLDDARRHKIIQMERFGFVRVTVDESKPELEIVGYFAHK